MDIDRFVEQHRDGWDRLAVLTKQAAHPSHLRDGELDELVQRYQRVSTHLSYARTYLPDPALIARLTTLVAEANGAIYTRRGRARAAVRRFATGTFPGAVWANRWFILVAAALTFLPAVALGTWIAHSSAAFEATAPSAVREAYVNEDFEDYYSSRPAAEFATEVFTNNVRVAVFAFAAGVLGCVVTAWVLVQNGANVGVAAGLFTAVGQPAKFWGLIVPHGLLELSAVIVAGGAGLRLGWTLIDPGDRPRRRALAEEGRTAASIVLGLVAAFAVAGTIEGFVTGRGLPTVLRVGIGVAAFAAFWSYVLVLGRRAAAVEAAGAYS